MNRLAYRFWLDDDIVAIEDLGGEESVTVHIDEVIRDIGQEVGPLSGKYLIYADSLGIWDAVNQEGTRFVIYPIGAYAYPEARQLLREWLAQYGTLNCPIQPYQEPESPA